LANIKKIGFLENLRPLHITARDIGSPHDHVRLFKSLLIAFSKMLQTNTAKRPTLISFNANTGNYQVWHILAVVKNQFFFKIPPVPLPWTLLPR
jgi:hypothetical protein